MALLYDGVHMVAKALTDLDRSHRVQVRPLLCDGGGGDGGEDDDETRPWEYGTSLLNYMKWVSVRL